MTLFAHPVTPLRPLGPALSLVQAPDGTLYAQKRLAPQALADADAVARFALEAHRASRLDHPALAGAPPGQAFDPAAPAYMMAYVEGPPATHVRPEALTAVVARVAAALGALHRAGYVHAGLEPERVRLADGGAVLLGWGHLTPVGLAAERAGHPAYRSPEQAAGLPLDGRSDLYGLGALVVFWRTGEPYGGDRSRLEGSGDPLLALARRLVASDPADRPADAEAVLAALGAAPLEPAVEAGPSPEAVPWLVPATLPRPTLLAALMDALGELEPTGGCVGLWGPRDAGKRTVLEQLEHLCVAAGWPVARLDACGDAATPLAPWQALIDGLAGDRDRPAPKLAARAEVALDPAGFLARRLLALEEALQACAPAGLVVLVRDWALADEASQRVLERLCRPGGPAIRFVAAAEAPLPCARASAVVAPLTASEAEALAGATLAGAEAPAPVARSIAEGALGQPGWLVARARWVREAGFLRRDDGLWRLLPYTPWPANAAELASRRVGALGDAASAVASALAALDGPLGVGTLFSGVAGEPARAAEGLDALLRAGVVEGTSRALNFAWEGYALAVVPDLEAPGRVLARREPLQSPAAELGRLALLAYRAEDATLLAALALPAARQAWALGASERASWLLQEVLVTMPVGASGRERCLATLAGIEAMRGALTEAVALYDTALATDGLGPERSATLAARARLQADRGQWSAARDGFREAAATAVADERPDALVRALVGLAEAQTALGELASAIESAEEALGAAAEAAPGPRALAMACLGHLLATVRRERQAEGLALLQRACGSFEADGDVIALLATLLKLADAGLARGEPRASAEASERAIALATSLDEPASLAQALLARSLAAWDLDDRVRALALARAATAREPGNGALCARALAIEGLARQAGGERAVGPALAGEAVVAAGEAPAPALAAWLCLQRAQVLLNEPSEDADAARRAVIAVAGALSQARQALDRAARPDLEALSAWLLGNWALAAGDRDRARLEWRAVLGQPHQLLAVRAGLALGRLAAEAGQAAEALGWFEQAQRGARALGLEALAAEALEAESALSAPSRLDLEDPHAVSRRLASVLDEARALLPRLSAPGRTAAEAARVRSLEALATLWPRLLVASAPAAIAEALAEAAFEASEVASRAVVLGRSLEPLAARDRTALALAYSPSLIQAALCRQALASGLAAFDAAEGCLAVPLSAARRPEGVLFVRGVGPGDRAGLEAIARAAGLAIAHLPARAHPGG